MDPLSRGNRVYGGCKRSGIQLPSREVPAEKRILPAGSRVARLLGGIRHALRILGGEHAPSRTWPLGAPGLGIPWPFSRFDGGSGSFRTVRATPGHCRGWRPDSDQE